METGKYREMALARLGELKELVAVLNWMEPDDREAMLTEVKAQAKQYVDVYARAVQMRYLEKMKEFNEMLEANKQEEADKKVAAAARARAIASLTRR